MERTIAGFSPKELLEKMEGMFTQDDYVTTSDLDYPYIPDKIMSAKWKKLLGFNYTQEPVPNGKGEWVELVDLNGKAAVAVCQKVSILDDNGNVFISVTKMGTAGVTFKKDTNVPVSLADNIKSAETDAFKRAVFHFCGKPEKPIIKNKTISAETKLLTIVKSGNLIRNGMITAYVDDGNTTKDFVIFTKKVTEIASSLKLSEQEFAAKLTPGTVISAGVTDDTYNGKVRYVCQSLSFSPDTTNNSNEKEFAGNIKLSSAASLSNDNAVSFEGILADGTACHIIISPQKAIEFAQMLGRNVADLTEGFRSGQKYFVSGILKGTLLQLSEIKRAKKEGVN